MKVNILGNLFSIEIKSGSNGGSYGEVTITESVRNSDANAEKKYERIYWNGRCSENRANFIKQYFKKGKAISAEGTCTRRVVKQEDGSHKEWHNIWFDNFNFVPNDFTDDAQGQSAPAQAQQGQSAPAQKDSPFDTSPSAPQDSPFDTSPSAPQDGDSTF